MVRATNPLSNWQDDLSIGWVAFSKDSVFCSKDSIRVIPFDGFKKSTSLPTRGDNSTPIVVTPVLSKSSGDNTFSITLNSVSNNYLNVDIVELLLNQLVIPVTGMDRQYLKAGITNVGSNPKTDNKAAKTYKISFKNPFITDELIVIAQPYASEGHYHDTFSCTVDTIQKDSFCVTVKRLESDRGTDWGQTLKISYVAVPKFNYLYDIVLAQEIIDNLEESYYSQIQNLLVDLYNKRKESLNEILKQRINLIEQKRDLLIAIGKVLTELHLVTETCHHTLQLAQISVNEANRNVMFTKERLDKAKTQYDQILNDHSYEYRLFGGIIGYEIAKAIHFKQIDKAKKTLEAAQKEYDEAKSHLDLAQSNYNDAEKKYKEITSSTSVTSQFNQKISEIDNLQKQETEKAEVDLNQKFIDAENSINKLKDGETKKKINDLINVIDNSIKKGFNKKDVKSLLKRVNQIQKTQQKLQDNLQTIIESEISNIPFLTEDEQLFKEYWEIHKELNKLLKEKQNNYTLSLKEHTKQFTIRRDGLFSFKKSMGKSYRNFLIHMADTVHDSPLSQLLMNIKLELLSTVDNYNNITHNNVVACCDIGITTLDTMVGREINFLNIFIKEKNDLLEKKLNLEKQITDYIKETNTILQTLENNIQKAKEEYDKVVDGDLSKKLLELEIKFHIPICSFHIVKCK
ncbi:hypothetical protein ABK040_003044 [Willaertia magna]